MRKEGIRLTERVLSERTSEEGPGPGEDHVMNIGHLATFHSERIHIHILNLINTGHLSLRTYTHILNATCTKYNDINGSLTWGHGEIAVTIVTSLQC